MMASKSSMTGRLSGQFIDEWQYILILGGWAGFVDLPMHFWSLTFGRCVYIFGAIFC